MCAMHMPIVVRGYLNLGHDLTRAMQHRPGNLTERVGHERRTSGTPWGLQS